MKTTILSNSNDVCKAFMFFCIFVVCSAIPAQLLASEVRMFCDYQDKALQSIKEQFENLKAIYPDDPELKRFGRRIEMTNKLSVEIVRQFKKVKLRVLQNMISIETNPSQTSNVKKDSLLAYNLILEYQTQFLQPLPIPDINQEELNILQEYYNISIKTASDFIAPRCYSVVIIDSSAATDVLGLCMVMPFLHIADNDWSETHMDSLPDLMKKSECLKILEEFSFKAKRPYTAYRFFLYQTKGRVDKFEADFFLENSYKHVKVNDYLNAIRCLKAGLDIASGLDDKDGAEQLHLELADIYYKLSHLHLAIEEMEKIFKNYPQHQDYCKTVALQLKYLYEDGEYKEVIRKYPLCLDGDKCQSYRSQIMYIAWLASRKEGMSDSAVAIKKEFMAKYSQHPLCANMLFDEAINALSNGNYREARQVLEKIEYHYPKSSILSKVRELKERLTKIQ